MTTTDITTNRLITPELQAAFKGYGLYSQDGKRKDAVCIAVFSIGNIRWYMLEGQPQCGDFIFFGIVTGLHETEYGYVSANEMAGITIDRSRCGLGMFHVEQDKSFRPRPLADIDDTALQSFLSRLYDND